MNKSLRHSLAYRQQFGRECTRAGISRSRVELSIWVCTGLSTGLSQHIAISWRQYIPELVIIICVSLTDSLLLADVI